jgi:uncharacterized membrane protein YfcA
MDIFSWVLATGCVILAGCVRGFSGFGSALILMPLLSMLIDPHQAVATVILLESIASVELLPKALLKTTWRDVLPMAIAAMLVVPVGAHLLVILDPYLMRRMIAGLLLAVVLILLSGKRYCHPLNRSIKLGTGIASGLLTGFAGVGGIPIVLYHLAGPDDALTNRSNFITFFALTQIVAVLSYWMNGILSAQVFFLFMLLAPSFAMSLMVGSRFFKRANEAIFRQITLLILLGIALLSFW